MRSSPPTGNALRRSLRSARLTALGRLRRGELRSAYQHLGIAPSLTWLALPDGDVTRFESDVASHLRQIVTSETLVLAPWHRDGHPDHDAVGRAAVDVGNERESDALGVSGLGMALGGAGRRRLSLVPSPAVAADRSREEAGCHRLLRHASSSRRGPWSSTGPVLPATVLDRFHRSFEVVFT